MFNLEKWLFCKENINFENIMRLTSIVAYSMSSAKNMFSKDETNKQLTQNIMIARQFNRIERVLTWIVTGKCVFDGKWSKSFGWQMEVMSVTINHSKWLNIWLLIEVEKMIWYNSKCLNFYSTLDIRISNGNIIYKFLLKQKKLLISIPLGVMSK